MQRIKIMKKIGYAVNFTIVVLTMFIVSDCGLFHKADIAQKEGASELSSDSPNAMQSHTEFKVNEYVINENENLRDPVVNIIWKYHPDNPTTYFRCRLGNSVNSDQLPSIEQLITLLEKVSYQLNQKKDKGNIKLINWFEKDCDFLSSSSIRTSEGEILYEVIRWNASTLSYNKEAITGGDLVTILLIENQ